MSDNFTKMVNNKWIQDGWEPKAGDYYTLFWTKGKYKGKHGIDLSNPLVVDFDEMIRTKEDLYHSDMQQAVWLPTIEQLMEMVDHLEYDFTLQKRYDQGKYIGYAKIDGGREYDVFPQQRVATAQELWLAFVMHELHGLKWDGERWTP